MEKKAKENTGLFHSWQALPLSPHPAPCSFPYLSHKFWAKQWQDSPALDLVFTEGKSGSLLAWITVPGASGLEGGLPRWLQACPGDLPRDQEERPVIILRVKLSNCPEILHKTSLKSSIPFQVQGEASIWNKLLRNFVVSSKFRERDLCCYCLYRMWLAGEKLMEWFSWGQAVQYSRTHPYYPHTGILFNSLGLWTV